MEKLKIGLFWGSDTGNTDGIAVDMKKKLDPYFDIESHVMNKVNDKELFNQYDYLIFGLSTWYDGELQSDWEFFFEDFCTLDFTNKKVAIFGLGDQYGYGEWFCDGIGILGKQVIDKNGTLIGWWPTEGYEFDESKSVLKENYFCGLPLDEDNQCELTEERIEKWTDQIKNEFLGN
tara:strand:- start:576 stop:1103 length:528 start_codon:yes stop_codon:yes gene_type:complete